MSVNTNNQSCLNCGNSEPKGRKWITFASGRVVCSAQCREAIKTGHKEGRP